MADQDLESQGLIAHSYDSLFSIRKIIRKINDIQIPVKHGLATNQIGAFILGFVVSVILYGLIVVPLLNLLGVDRNAWITIGCLFGPPFLLAQRIAKPMAYGKTIGGTTSSWLRYLLDDRVHRRGLPIPTPRQPVDIPVQHYQRSWVLFQEFAQDHSAEQDWSDEVTEERLAGSVVPLQSWLDTRAKLHLEAEQSTARKRESDADLKANFKRGRAASVVMHEEIDDSERSNHDDLVGGRTG
jgi:fluoride ion exporter CrcB/FEX